MTDKKLCNHQGFFLLLNLIRQSDFYFRFFAFSAAFLFLTACGQVGEITGGGEDTTAPRMILNKVEPPIGSTQIYPQKINIPFDEYIELNKPAENISVSPNDVQLDYAIKNKSLLLQVKSGAWQPNTTYTIYLNRAVKDITERNDSIMAYVFSTGSFLDSLQTAVKIVDAYTGNPSKNITVGLYQQQLENDTAKIYPRYFSITDNEGIAVFRNIKDTTFFLYAFDDKNRNNRLDETESRAALKNPVDLYFEDTIEIISPVIRLMPPEEKELTIISNEVVTTATWCIGFNRSLKENEYFEFVSVPNEIIWSKEKDSVSAFFETNDKSGTFTGVLIQNNKTDTITKRYFFREQPKLIIENNIFDKKLRFNDTLKLKINEPFKNIDTSLIKLKEILEKDSVGQNLNFSVYQVSITTIGVLFDKNSAEKVLLKIPVNSLAGINYQLKDSLNLEFLLQKEKETGTLIVEFDTIPPYGILFVANKRTKEEYSIIFDGKEKVSHQISFLDPGQYEFYYLLDENRDGRWTTGSIFEDMVPETIIRIESIATIRPNWEVKTPLSLTTKPTSVKAPEFLIPTD